ncbi:MAG: glycosyltransferase, partial [Clostridia bacterium]|nr:glycosyltransferase [Clostridia bacterium]
GILVPAKDCGALAEAVISLINDPALLKALGVGAYSVYKEKFTCEKMTRSLEALYEQQTKRK